MARKAKKPYWQKLSWHNARKQWKKFRNGKYYYLGESGVNRSDRQAHDVALAEWRRILGKVDKDEERERLDQIREEHEEALPAVEACWMDPDNSIQRRLTEIIVDTHGVRDHPDFALPPTSGLEADSIGSAIDQFLAYFKSLVLVGERSESRQRPLEHHLEHFRQWIGGSEPLSSVNGAMLTRYHAYLLQQVADKKISAAYGHDLQRAVKQWIRWAWQNELLFQLPRNLDTLHIRIPLKAIEHLEVNEARRILAAADDRLKLYLSLALLCGMTAKDMADLRHSEVNLKKGVITRQRSKTRHHGDDVPTVTYTLPKPVAKLLRGQATQGKQDDRVLLTTKGHPLVHGNRSDAVRLQFNRTLKQVNQQVGADGKPLPQIKATMKMLRSTSANLLEQQLAYKPVVTLWLGHSPRSIKDRHYVSGDQALLDQAVGWLAEQYGLAK